MDTATCQLNDNELIMGYVNGDYSCFETLLARYQSKVYGYIISVVKDKDVADDIFQDTFFKVVYTINSGLYRDENKFIHWVMRIAHNLIVDYFRRTSKMPFVPNKPDCDVVETLRVHDVRLQRAHHLQGHLPVRRFTGKDKAVLLPGNAVPQCFTDNYLIFRKKNLQQLILR